MQRFGRVELQGMKRKGAAGRSHMLDYQQPWNKKGNTSPKTHAESQKKGGSLESHRVDIYNNEKRATRWFTPLTQPGTWEAEADGSSWFQDQSDLHKQFQASSGCIIRHWLTWKYAIHTNVKVILLSAFFILVGNLIFEHHTDYFCHTLKELDDAPLP